VTVLYDRLRVTDGIAFADGAGGSAYRARWEQEAETNHVRSAVASSPSEPTDETLETLTLKVAPLWARIPRDRHVGTLLDIGAGYGRIDLYLSQERGLTCDTFCAVDISEGMLRRLLEYRERFDVFPGADVHALCISAHDLPIDDDSVDLVVSSVVFLHMGKGYVRRAVAEIARVLKPGGAFVFDASFPNALNPPSYPHRLKPQRLRNPNAMKFWTRSEVERLVHESGLAAQAGPFRIEPSGFGLVPKSVGPLTVPFARRVNAAIGTPTHLRSVLATSYSVFSESAFA
jgi:SAM-dependent methyltransferase